MADHLTLTRMGCLKLTAKDGVLPAEDASNTEAGKRIFDELVAIINASPIVVDEPLVPEYTGCTRRIGTNEISFFAPIGFRVHLPMKNQDDDPVSADEKVEDFEIWYNGRIVSATVVVERPLSTWQSFSVGRQAVRIVEEMLNQSELFEYVLVGPYAMFTACYLGVAETTTPAEFGRALERRHLTWESFVSVGSREEAHEAIFGLRSAAETFYHLMDGRVAMDEQMAGLDAHFEIATDMYQSMVSGWKWWPREWWEQRKARQSLRAEIGAAYGAYASAEVCRTEISERVTMAREEFARHPGLQSTVDYPESTVRREISWDARHILEALKFIAEESRSSRLEAATVVAPLAGAVVGAGATALGILLTR